MTAGRYNVKEKKNDYCGHAKSGAEQNNYQVPKCIYFTWIQKVLEWRGEVQNTVR